MDAGLNIISVDGSVVGGLPHELAGSTRGRKLYTRVILKQAIEEVPLLSKGLEQSMFWRVSVAFSSL